ncbi:DEAD/DEAH box helicase [Roseibacterium sp. SDUM158017]|uniref:DEAD/DEAH box helicase n=1 Tax=Roseicyclus salinarum TaxID=3036773 RepID=UPI0024154DC0|nr:DEAD/DEAH box helicase [Roseibacterium sp. SDUM158017]MDG4649288.1 DEAD/DEAH box helicase [Roseibacterium sp. SDUM158017]
MTSFSDLNLNPKVLKAVAEAGYETPTPIQEGAIPPALEGRDVLGIAQTGTGKTASFTLPMITALARGRARARMPRSLVLCPTRELAAQVAENFDTYAKYVKLTKALLIGGVSFKEQDQLIDKGVDVLIATPGRLLDHFERGKLILTDVKVMVVDEADRMLDMGFIPDIERIFGLVPFTRQTLFFSATMAPEIERITNTFLSNPARVEVARQASASLTIEQRLVEFTPTRRDTSAANKREMLRAIIEAEGAACTNAIIFCNRKVDVDIVAKSLKKHGLNAEPIHGDLDQSHRTRTLDGFRDGSIRFLVASDVAARGLDIPNVSHVINYDVPSHAEDYVHRIGRTGRAGRKGVAVTISVPSDAKYLGAIESLIETTIPRVEAPWTPDAKPGGGRGAKDEDTEREAPTRRRRGRGAAREETAPAETAPAPAKPEAQPVAEAPARTEPRAPVDTAETRDTDESGDRRHRRERGGKGRGTPGRDRNGVIGMGDHLPGFIAMSFDERRGGPARDVTETPEDEAEASDADPAPQGDAPQGDAPKGDAPQAEAAKPAPKRRRSRSRKSAGDAAAEDADTAPAQDAGGPGEEDAA